MLEQTLIGVPDPIVVEPESEASETDLATIHALKNPPLEPLTLDAIYVRRCRLAGDVLDSKGGCFRTEDLPRLLEMVQGAPALIGHDRSQKPTARFFGGSIEEHDGHRYIVPKFYWLKAHSHAEDLRLEIDGGLINEASIAFLFTTPTCSICGGDIRDCEHQVGEQYNGCDCFYYYDGIDMVTEGSLVYRGAEPGTALLPNQLSVRPFLLPVKNSTEPLPKIRYRGKLWRILPDRE